MTTLYDGEERVQPVRMLRADGSAIDANAPFPVTASIPGVSATGSLGALNATVALSLAGATGFAVDLRGTFVATTTFQGTIDGTNWFTVAVIPAGASVNQASVTTSAAAGAWIGNANGMQQVRAIATAYTSGSVTVTLRAMTAAGVVVSMPSGATSQTAVLAAGAATIGNVGLVAGTANVGNVGEQIPAPVADVASAALTTTTTTSAFTPTTGSSYSVQIAVTAVSGTAPTLDVSVEESLDGGTNWFSVYSFPRITTTGSYRSPVLNLTGNRVRYVQTVAGTTPSFTRSVNRLQGNASPTPATSLPPTAVQLAQGSGNVANAQAQVVFAAVPNQTNYITGYSITGGGSTAGSAVQSSLTGPLGGATYHSVVAPVGALVPFAPIVRTFNPPLAASGPNTALTLTLPALGTGNLAASVEMTGFRV